MSKESKKISSYGFKVLDELVGDRKSFREGTIAPEQARAVIGGVNATARMMHETVNASKFERGNIFLKVS